MKSDQAYTTGALSAISTSQKQVSKKVIGAKKTNNLEARKNSKSSVQGADQQQPLYKGSQPN